MEQSKPAMTAAADLIKQAALGPQARHFWEAQESILSEAEAFSKHWFERRHTATKTALEAAKTIAQNGSTDPGAMMKAISDWQTHSMQRVVEDFQEWVALCSRCATHVADHETRSVEADMEKAAETVSSSVRSKQ